MMRGRGFSLIELLVVVAIVVVLAAVAAPFMQENMTRGRVVEAIRMSGIHLKVFAENYSLDNASTTTIITSGLGPYVTSITINYSNPDVVILLGGDSEELHEDLVELALTYVPTFASNGEITWNCTYDGMSYPNASDYITAEQCAEA